MSNSKGVGSFYCARSVINTGISKNKKSHDRRVVSSSGNARQGVTLPALPVHEPPKIL